MEQSILSIIITEKREGMEQSILSIIITEKREGMEQTRLSIIFTEERKRDGKIKSINNNYWAKKCKKY